MVCPLFWDYVHHLIEEKNWATPVLPAPKYRPDCGSRLHEFRILWLYLCASGAAALAHTESTHQRFLRCLLHTSAQRWGELAQGVLRNRRSGPGTSRPPPNQRGRWPLSNRRDRRAYSTTRRRWRRLSMRCGTAAFGGSKNRSC